MNPSAFEQLIPQDHLLQKIDAVLDFEFIRDEVKHLYRENNGRPGIDPVILFKILFIGYLYGVRSERQLIREIEVTLAYRWFLGYNIQSPHSTISQKQSPLRAALKVAVIFPVFSRKL